MPDVADDELARLRAADERATRAEADAKAARDGATARDADVAAERERIRRALSDPVVVRQLATQAGVLSAHAPASSDDDPDAPLSRRDLERARAQWRDEDARASLERDTALQRNQRALHRSDAARRHGAAFAKRADEIDAYLDKLDPSVAAQPTAYDEVYAYVRSKHIDEEIDEAVARRTAPAPVDDDDEASAAPAPPLTPAAAGAASTPAAAVPRREPPIVGGQASARAQTTLTKPKLTREERHYAERMGLSEDDWAAANDWDVDWLGMNGRRNV